jgi:hypothetical protein
LDQGRRNHGTMHHRQVAVVVLHLEVGVPSEEEEEECLEVWVGWTWETLPKC